MSSSSRRRPLLLLLLLLVVVVVVVSLPVAPRANFLARVEVETLLLPLELQRVQCAQLFGQRRLLYAAAVVRGGVWAAHGRHSRHRVLFHEAAKEGKNWKN